MEFDLERPFPSPPTYNTTTTQLPSFEKHNINTSIFNIESQHMPTKPQHFHISFRSQTISFISNLSQHLDPLLTYLAINYLDRFLSVQPIREEKPWIFKLVAVSCVSLAVKMKKAELLSVTHIQNYGFIFDKETIGRMELLILGALKWRMSSVTPFSFINFFVSFFKFQDPQLTRALKSRATKIIFKSQFGIKILEFKPSIVAASALLSASHELFPHQFPCLQKAISNCGYVNKINLEKCNNVIQEIARDEYKSVFDTVCVNVVHRRQWSSSSSISETITDDEGTDMIKIRECNKRRKIKSYRSDETSQVSEIEQC